MADSVSGRKNSGESLMIVGLILLVTAACLFSFNMIVQNTAQDTADKALAEIALVRPEPREIVNGVYKDTADEPVEFEIPDFILNPSLSMPEMTVDGRPYSGTLAIPSLGVEVPVCSDDAKKNLRLVPCIYSGNAYRSDMVICAHNYPGQFGKLKNLSQGDEISFIDMSGNVFVYSVTEIEMLGAGDVEYLNSGEWDLTLFTCTMSAQNRITVRCEKTE